MHYPIVLQGRQVGDASITRHGMYYRIVCQIFDPDLAGAHVLAGNEDKTVNIGICVPQDGGCIAQKRFPVRLLQIETCSFTVQRFCAEHQHLITEDSPFPNIRHLRKARLLIKGERLYAVMDQVPEAWEESSA